MRFSSLTNRMPWRSQSVKAILLLSLAMATAIAVGTAVLLLDLRARELAHAKGEVTSLSRILAEQTTRTIDGVALSMRGARDRLSDGLGSQLDLASPPIHLLLNSRITGLPQVKSMFVTNSDGMVANSSRADFKTPFSVAERDFFKYISNNRDDELYISRPERARIDGNWTYYIAIRLTDRAGNFRGVLASAINIDYFEQLYESISLDFVSRISLLNRDGVFMAGQNHDQDMLGKAIVAPELFTESPAHLMGEQVVSSSDGYGKRWFSVYRTVSKYPLVISPAVMEEEALGPWRRVALPILGGALVMETFIALATLLIVLNLLKKERLEFALKESDEQIRHMVQSARDAILSINASHEIVLFNKAAERMFHTPVSEAINKRIDDFLNQRQPDLLALNLMRYINEALQATPGLAVLGIISLSRNEKDFPVELSLSTTTFRGETLVTAVFRDLSERQSAESELLDKNLRLQELSASLEKVREEERLRISRELHDELGQSLTGIRMGVSWLGNRLQSHQPDMASKVAGVKNMIDSTIAAVRRISSELRPLVLDDLGFSAAASWYVNQFSERSGIAVSLSLPEQDPVQGGPVEIALFRILQESLTNIARHANARSATIHLRAEARQWVMSIQDDGNGFDSDLNRTSTGIGLMGMRERVQMLGGTLHLSSVREHGALVEVRIPIERE